MTDPERGPYVFVVPGRPYAPRSGAAKRYQDGVRQMAISAIPAPLVGHLYIRLHYYYTDSRLRLDGDNLLKVVCDALKGCAYQDDGQIDEHHVHRTNLGISTTITDIPTPELFDYIARYKDFVIIEIGVLG